MLCNFHNLVRIWIQRKRGLGSWHISATSYFAWLMVLLVYPDSVPMWILGTVLSPLCPLFLFGDSWHFGTPCGMSLRSTQLFWQLGIYCLVVIYCPLGYSAPSWLLNAILITHPIVLSTRHTPDRSAPSWLLGFSSGSQRAQGSSQLVIGDLC